MHKSGHHQTEHGMTSKTIPRSEAEHGKTPTCDETGTTISRLSGPEDIEAHLPSLRTLLQSCVNTNPSTSSIGFLAPLSDADADRYWRSLATSSLGTTCYLFILLDKPTSKDDSGTGEVAATAQLFTIPKATHAHRGEVAKLLVRPSSRRSGLGRAMMAHIECFARDVLGLKVLTLDTETDTPARAFYGRTGWTEWGTCPDYAMFADGRLGSATFFVKSL
jgi:GNAT superfamily N-acetyltransferase